MTDDVREWLAALGMGAYADQFATNDIEFDLLGDLDDSDLRDIGVSSLGHRKRILRAIADGEGIRDETNPGAATPRAAERRLLTVMFCDLVGSTALSRRLDPEDLRDVMRRYQDAVAGAVTRYGGHVAKYLGDGILAYFGWPQAYEDQAERAVRAGLDAVNAVKGVELRTADPLSARVGIATGQVVVGDLVGESGKDAEAVTGETPNLAARLQGLASPSQVLISEATRQLIGRTFSLVDTGHHDLKGFDDDVQAWRVGQEDRVDSRFEAVRGTSSLPIVGRDSELRLLVERWRLAEGGEGQAVLISGEAGIGKSRLLQSLTDTLAGGEHANLRFQCSPYHSNSALYPVIRHLEQAAGFDQADDGANKLAKLRSLLEASNDDASGDLPFLADLLSLSHHDGNEALDLPPQQVRTRLFEVLTSRILKLADERPVLMMFEDAHWIDPTSLELLSRTLDRLDASRILLLVTHRPEWESQIVRNDVTALHLNRLGRRQGAEIVRAITGGDASDEVVERIIERTDGIPLFVEELTRHLVESGASMADADIPASLQASLSERLDRLGNAKEIAQIGAVVGREVPHAVLAAVAEASSADINSALARLHDSGLFVRKGEPPDAVYSFKHALIRDAAYDSLLMASRRDWHRRTGKVLEEAFPAVLEGEPEVVAHHWHEAGETEKALPLYLRAGQNASRRSANREAVAHLSRALTIYDERPDEAKQKNLELDILAAYSLASMAARGYGNKEVGQLLRRAYDVCKQADDEDRVFQITWNLWLHHQVAGDYELAGTLAEEVIQLAEQNGEEEHVLEAHHAVWTTALNQGRLTETWDHCEKGIALYSPEKYHECTFTYGGHDAGVCGLAHASIALSALGRAKDALNCGQQAVSLAEQLGHGPSITTANALRNIHLIILRDKDALMDASQRCITAAERYGPPHFGAFGRMGNGWALAADGNFDDGIAHAEAAVAQYKNTGALVRLPVALMVLADVFRASGDLAAAQATVDEALARIAADADRTCWADTIRLKGQILYERSGEPEEIEALFQEAISVAAGQQAKLFELRAATGLANLQRDQGRDQEARSLLTFVCGKFSEGDKLADLELARSTLKELQ
jgi:predicted ATPase/class 3 adenylate cyclase